MRIRSWQNSILDLKHPDDCCILGNYCIEVTRYNTLYVNELREFKNSKETRELLWSLYE